MQDMIDIEKFISEHITGRDSSLFARDIAANDALLRERIAGRRLLVIGGAGSIGSSYIKAMLAYGPSQLVVVDLNENGLDELTRDLRSTQGLRVPDDYRTYTLDFDSEIFRRIFRANGGFDIVANFSAHKHVRSEKDRYSVEALLENNVLKARRLLDLLAETPPERFFCVSTDKAANPANVMGASKRLMEDLVMARRGQFCVTTARFANVAFSNGSLLDGFIQRMMKRQPLAAPADVRRYFVSPAESGQICMMACMLGRSGEIFFPRLDEHRMMRFSDICDSFLRVQGLEPYRCADEAEARSMAAGMSPDSRLSPVCYTPSDTTGEKQYEEFYTPDETPDMARFASMGVLTAAPVRTAALDRLLDYLAGTFAADDFSKADIVDALRGYVPGFEHTETGRNLDQKM